MNDFFIKSEIEAQRKGPLSILTLNRPEKLNALNMDMIRMMAANVARGLRDDDIKAFIFKGAGERAFCAGGDIVSTYYAGMDFRKGNISLDVATLFFGEEYSLNRKLFHLSKPSIALMKGITMGGGYGIAGNTKYPVACAETIFAMPETRIGFFVDIGAMYHLNQIPSKALGRYLAMTGENLYGRDVYDAGLASHFIPSDQFNVLEEALISGLDAGQGAEDVLSKFHAPSGDSVFLADNLGWIERVFSNDNLDDIVKALKDAPEDAAKETLDVLLLRSPTSVRICLEYFNRARDMDFDTVINMDYFMARKFSQGLDFYEGIRATLIDRDKKPQWSPSSFSAVSDEMIAPYFDAEARLLDAFENMA